MLSSDRHWLLYASTETSEKKAGAAKSCTLIRLFAIMSLVVAAHAQARMDERIVEGELRIVARTFRVRRNRRVEVGQLGGGWASVSVAWGERNGYRERDW